MKACSAGSERFEYKYQRAASGGDISPTAIDEEEEEEREWVAQVEPGVLITFVSLSSGGNDLKRIRFRYSLFVGRTGESGPVLGYCRLVPGPLFDFFILIKKMKLEGLTFVPCK